MADGKNLQTLKRMKRKLAARKRKGVTDAQIRRAVGIIPRSLKPELNIKMNFTYGSVFANDTTQVTRGAITFRLQDMPDHALYTGMFDQYRFNKVVVKFVPTLTTVVNRPYDDHTSVLVTAPCKLAGVIDRDDATLPSTTTGYEDIIVRKDSKHVTAGKPLTFTFQPNRLLMTWRSATTTGYKVDQDYKGFNDCAQHDIEHFGLKYALTPFSPVNCFQYSIEMTWYMSFRDRRH